MSRILLKRYCQENVAKSEGSEKKRYKGGNDHKGKGLPKEGGSNLLL